MNENTGSSGTQILLAFLAGAAAGAVIALLTAPRSGRETREKLGDITRDMRAKATRVPQAVGTAFDRAAKAGREAFRESFSDEPGPGNA